MEMELAKLVEVVMVEVGLVPAATVEVVPVLAVMAEVPEDMVVVVTEDLVIVLVVVVVGMAGLVVTEVVVPEVTVEVDMATMV